MRDGRLTSSGEEETEVHETQIAHPEPQSQHAAGLGNPQTHPFYCLNLLNFIPSYQGKNVQGGKKSQL